MGHYICLKVKLHTILHCTMNVAWLSMHLPDTKPKWRWWLIRVHYVFNICDSKAMRTAGGKPVMIRAPPSGSSASTFYRMRKIGKWGDGKEKEDSCRTWKTSRRGQIEAVGSIFARILSPPGHLYIKGEKETLPLNGDGKFQKEHVE